MDNIRSVILKSKRFFLLCAVVALVSCSEKGITPAAGEIGVEVSAGVLPGVRGSDEGGLANVTGMNLRFILEIFDAKGVSLGQYYMIKDPVKPSGTSADFSVRLLEGNYKFVMWADFTGQAVTGQVKGTSTAADLHYDTSDLKSVSSKSRTPGDESLDAYTCSRDVRVAAGVAVPELTLRRPFGKIRVMAGDIAASDLPESLEVVYTTPVANSYDAYSGTAGTGSVCTLRAEGWVPGTGQDAGLLYTDYVFAPAGGSPYGFEVTVTTASGRSYSREITDVTLAANKLTTVKCSFGFTGT